MKNRPSDIPLLRIAMFGQKKAPDESGGVEVAVGQLAVRMAKSGHSVTLYNRRKVFLEDCRIKQYRGVRLRYVPSLPIKGLSAVSSSFLAAIRSAFGPYDIVHIHAEGPALMCLLPKLTGKRVIVTIHGLDHQRAKWGHLASAYLKLSEACAVRHADEIIVLSRNTEQYFRRVYKRETRYLPNGICRTVKVPAREIRSCWGLDEEEYILFLGRLVPEKGLTILIEAFRQINTEKKLVIAGCASDTEAFVRDLHRQADGDERILFTGEVHGVAKEELYSNAYCYVLPSTLEGMPISLLEALSFGCCCLTSDIPECLELTRGYGASFRTGDAESLREVLQSLCDDRERVLKYREAAESFPMEEHNWDDITRKTVELYYGNQ